MIAVTLILISIVMLLSISVYPAHAEIKVLDKPLWIFPGQRFRIALEQPPGSGQLDVDVPDSLEMFDRWPKDSIQRFYFRAVKVGDASLRFHGAAGEETREEAAGAETRGEATRGEVAGTAAVGAAGAETAAEAGAATVAEAAAATADTNIESERGAVHAAPLFSCRADWEEGREPRQSSSRGARLNCSLISRPRASNGPRSAPMPALPPAKVSR